MNHNIKNNSIHKKRPLPTSTHLCANRKAISKMQKKNVTKNSPRRQSIKPDVPFYSKKIKSMPAFVWNLYITRGWVQLCNKSGRGWTDGWRGASKTWGRRVAHGTDCVHVPAIRTDFRCASGTSEQSSALPCPSFSRDFIAASGHLSTSTTRRSDGGRIFSEIVHAHQNEQTASMCSRRAFYQSNDDFFSSSLVARLRLTE